MNSLSEHLIRLRGLWSIVIDSQLGRRPDTQYHPAEIFRDVWHWAGLNKEQWMRKGGGKLHSPARQDGNFFYLGCGTAWRSEGSSGRQLYLLHCSPAREDSEKRARVYLESRIYYEQHFFIETHTLSKTQCCFFKKIYFILTVFKATEVLFWPFNFAWMLLLMLCPAFVFIHDWRKSNVKENLAQGHLVFAGSVSSLYFPMYCYASVLTRKRC